MSATPQPKVHIEVPWKVHPFSMQLWQFPARAAELQVVQLGTKRGRVAGGGEADAATKSGGGGGGGELVRVYASQPPTWGFCSQYSWADMPAAQAKHAGVYAIQQD